MDKVADFLKLKGSDPNETQTQTRKEESAKILEKDVSASTIDKPKESPQSERREHHYIFSLALIIIIVFLIDYSLIAYSDRDKEYAGLEKVTSTLGPIVAPVVGYYFGQKPTQTLSEQAQAARNERDQFKRDLTELLTAQAELGQKDAAIRQDLEKKLQERDAIINNINSILAKPQGKNKK